MLIAKPKPYVGITGFNTQLQVAEIVKHVENYPVGYIMFGITSSNKRLLNPESAGKTSPALINIIDLREQIPKNQLPMIHYYTPNMATLVEEVVALWQYCELKNTGLQLNVDAPPALIGELLSELNATCDLDFNGGVLPIVLQISRKTLASMSDAEIINALQKYEGLLSYALIDPSGGEGKDIDMERACELLRLGKKLDITLGIAGGFSDLNVADRVKQLRKTEQCNYCSHKGYGSFCIDAQGKLADYRKISPVYPEDAPAMLKPSLNIARTKLYIDEALHSLYS